MSSVISFWNKIKKTDTCWNWIGAKSFLGYGRFKSGGRLLLAHRFSYELHKEKIPEGLTLDHLCRNPSCVRPDHLEAVTMKENTLRGIGPAAINARKTHCKRGHEFTVENTARYKTPYGIARECRTCLRARGKRRYAKRKAISS
jgi:hypothetical protein